MTKSDWQYLAFFMLFILLFIVSIYANQLVLEFVFGIFVLFFIVHLTLNLRSPPTVDDVLVLLKSVIDPEKSHEILNGDETDDYSRWQAFCDTPIINNKQLNRIRVNCYKLNNDADSRFFKNSNNNNTLTVTDDGIKMIRKLILEIENQITKRMNAV